MYSLFWTCCTDKGRRIRRVDAWLAKTGRESLAPKKFVWNRYLRNPSCSFSLAAGPVASVGCRTRSGKLICKLRTFSPSSRSLYVCRPSPAHRSGIPHTTYIIMSGTCIFGIPPLYGVNSHPVRECGRLREKVKIHQSNNAWESPCENGVPFPFRKSFHDM